jgi:nitroimidazol reductase NimA-like FMN-containing flavoprotein (pyridoxamine 5'-phosphate oxidase superfamily)
MEFSTEYAGVTAFGLARVVNNITEAEHGLYGLLGKYFPDHKPGKDYHAITADELARTSVFAIEIEAWSGKQKKAA